MFLLKDNIAYVTLFFFNYACIKEAVCCVLWLIDNRTKHGSVTNIE